MQLFLFPCELTGESEKVGRRRRLHQQRARAFAKNVGHRDGKVSWPCALSGRVYVWWPGECARTVVSENALYFYKEHVLYRGLDETIREDRILMRATCRRASNA